MHLLCMAASSHDLVFDVRELDVGVCQIVANCFAVSTG